MYRVMGGTVSFTDGAVCFCDVASLIGAPGEGLADRVGRQPFLEVLTERPRELLP